MPSSPIESFDLNLLRALEALLIEVSVTSAARRINVTQPAMSSMLRRLRSHFGDELLIRGGRKMTLTPRGEELIVPVREALSIVRHQLFAPATFDPAISSRTFTIQSSDYTSSILLGPALRGIARGAPNIRFSIVAPSINSEQRLENGEIDLILLPAGRALPGHPQVPLMIEGFEVIAARENGRATALLNEAEFLSLPHVGIQLGPNAYPSAELWLRNRFGTARHIAILVTAYTAVPDFIIGTDRIAVVYTSLAAAFEKAFPVRRLPCPVEIPPVRHVMQWRTSSNPDPGLLWLRERLTALAAGI